MAKTVLIPQTTFTGILTPQEDYYYNLNETKIIEDKITVVFDGVAYNVQNMSDENGDYGAPYDDEKFDFSTYPFNLYSGFSSEEESWITQVSVQDANEHTIEVYIEDEPVVTVKKPGVQVLQLDERLIIFDETTGDIVTFDGENWLLGNDGFGTGTKQSSYAVVGKAIVGKDVVAPNA